MNHVVVARHLLRKMFLFDNFLLAGFADPCRENIFWQLQATRKQNVPRGNTAGDLQVLFSVSSTF